MKIDYYQFKPPASNELQSMFYRVTTVDLRSIACIKHIFLDGRDNPSKDSMMRHTDRHRLYSMVKPAIAVYGYYINNPQVFGHNTDNLVGWMFQYSKNVLVKYDSKFHTYDEKIRIKNKFITRHKEYILRELEKDAKIVASKADHIESQRKIKVYEE